MERELIRELQTCTETAGHLLTLLEEEREDLRGCLGGELLAAYAGGTEKAVQLTERLQSELRLLLQEER